MKVDFTLINPVNHYRKTLVDNLAILNLGPFLKQRDFQLTLLTFSVSSSKKKRLFQKKSIGGSPTK